MRRVLAALAVSAAAACVGCGAIVHGPNAPAPGAFVGNGPRVVLDAQRSAPGWPDHPGATAWLEATGYHLLPRNPGQFVAARAPLADVPRQVQVSARFHKLGGPPGGGYGLIVDDRGTSRGDGVDQTGEYVVAEVGDRGQIGVWRRDQTRWIDLLAWTPSSIVAPADAPNQLDVRTMGTRVLFFVNGTQVANVDAGMSGPGVGVFAGGDANEVLVEQFTVEPVQALDNPPPAAAPTPATPGDPAQPPVWQRVQDQLVGIAQDMAAIYRSFAGGPNDPHNPVRDRSTLNDDAQRLAAAESKARQLADELQKLDGSGQPAH